MASNQRIDGQRLWDSLMAMAQIGATAKGGVRRLALSEVDRAGRRARFAAECVALGLTLRTDTIGNMFARRPPAATPPGCRCCSAATSTASRPAASSTARWASLPGSK